MPRGQDIGFRRICLGAVGFSNFDNRNLIFDTSITIRFRSSLFIIPDEVIAPPFPSTFTTKALYLSSLRIAVGTGISARPPHRSERAQFTHSAPTLGDLRRSALLARDVEYAASAAIDRLAASSFPRSPPHAGYDAGAYVAMRR